MKEKMGLFARAYTPGEGGAYRRSNTVCMFMISSYINFEHENATARC